jgi:hypothetical protein
MIRLFHGSGSTNANQFFFNHLLVRRVIFPHALVVTPLFL